MILVEDLTAARPFALLTTITRDQMTQIFDRGYALLIGVGNSIYPKWSLPTTVNDILALKSILIDPNLCAYPDNEQHVRLLHDGHATRHAILNGLAWLKTQAASNSETTVIVYYSGHGWLDSSSNNYYLIPHDTEPVDIPNSALSAQDFTNALHQIDSQRLLVVIDSCHAEGMATAKNKQASIKLPPSFVATAPPKNTIDSFKQGKGRAIFTSSRGEQSSWVRPDGSMSIYTYRFLEALQGAANQSGDKVIRLSNLMNHLGKTVPNDAYKLCKAEQIPFFDTATEDFSVAFLRGDKGLSKEGRNSVKEEAEQKNHQAVQATGDRSIAVGDSMANSQITSGDQNVIQVGKYNANIGNARDISIGK